MIRKFVISLFLIFLPVSALAAFPSPVGFVNDFANVLSSDSKLTLESQLKSFDAASGIEIAVATLPSLEGRTVEDVAVDLYKQWGIGKKGEDKGALFLIAPAEHRMRIEVGYGLEGVINDALAARLLDENVVPYFKEGNLDKGIQSGTIALIKTIADKERIPFNFDAASPATSEETTQGKKSTPFSILLKVLFFILMAYLFIRHPWLFLLFLSGGGRSGGGGGFGGFGGFGGGLSGGGGSSRGW